MAKELEEIKDSPIEIESDEIRDNATKLIVTVVKKGYAYEVVKAGNKAGAKGATILDGKGSAETRKKFFGADISPEKEVVLMVVKDSVVYPVIKEIYAVTGFKTNARGVVFALPVDFMMD